MERLEHIRRAAESAERAMPGWLAAARAHTIAYATANSGRVFTCTEARIYAEANNLASPPHQRAWGAVIYQLACDRVVVKAGLSTSGKPLWQLNQRP